MIDPGIEFYRSKSRKGGLKSPNVIEREAENTKPIDQLIARKDAEGQNLVNTWTEFPIAERAVEVVRNVMEGVALGERSRRSRYLRKRESASRENRPNPVCECRVRLTVSV
jgi:hypothetical protein